MFVPTAQLGLNLRLNFPPRAFLYTKALPAEKLTIWANCRFHTVTSKAKWMNFGWQCFTEVLHLSEIIH